MKIRSEKFCAFCMDQQLYIDYVFGRYFLLSWPLSNHSCKVSRAELWLSQSTVSYYHLKKNFAAKQTKLLL